MAKLVAVHGTLKDPSYPAKFIESFRNTLLEDAKMTTFSVSGGCLCGSVRYTVTNPANCVIHCHCSRCRKGHGGLVTTCAIVSRGTLVIEQGIDNLTTFAHPPEVKREFCRTCGCSLRYYTEKVPDTVFYYPATLDQGIHPGHPPESEHHIYVASKAEWERFETSLPWHEADIESADYEKSRSE